MPGVEATGAEAIGAEPNATAGLARQVVRGATWMVLLRMALRVFSVASQFLLVRILSPSDFGLVAGAGAAYAILDGLTETSMTLALVQMQSPQRHHYDTAWTLVVARGLLVGAVLWAAAPFVADFLHDERVTLIVQVLAIVPVVQGFESVGMVRLQRDLQFGRIFFYQLASRLAGFMTALPLALIYRSYWALVLGGAAAKLLAVPVSYLVAPHRPGLSLRAAGGMLSFSKWLLLNNVLSMAENFMMPIVLGHTGGIRAVGIYQVSYDLAALPASEVAAPVRRPMHAGYARVADDLPALRRQVLDGLGVLACLIVPMSAGICVTAPYAVHVALGAQWTEAAPVVALAALYTLFDALGHFTGGIYMVRHAQRPYVAIMAVCLALRLALVIPAALYGGVVPAAAMMAATAAFNAALWFWRLRTLLGVGWRDLAAPIWRTFAAAALMMLAVAAAEHAWPMQDAIALPQWLAFSALGAAVHTTAQLALWAAQGRPSGPEAQLLGRLSSRRSGRSRIR